MRVIHDRPSKVSRKTGEVVVLGPEDVDVSFTPKAAVVVAENLLEKAAEAVEKQDALDDACKRMAAKRAAAELADKRRSRGE